VSTIKVLSSWARVVAIWKNVKANGIGETKGVWRVGWDHLRRRVSNDRYHYDQGEKGDPMG
jgi:hypothetical protein